MSSLFYHISNSLVPLLEIHEITEEWVCVAPPRELTKLAFGNGYFMCYHDPLPFKGHFKSNLKISHQPIFVSTGRLKILNRDDSLHNTWKLLLDTCDQSDFNSELISEIAHACFPSLRTSLAVIKMHLFLISYCLDYPSEN